MSSESMKRWRNKYPLKAAYLTLKCNATRRGIPFEISFDYFKKFAYKTKLLTKRGRNSESFSVDRINPDIGYTEGTIQVLTISDNSFKGYLEREIYWEEADEFGNGGLKSKVHRPDNDLYPF